MRYLVLCSDYDGTLATEGQLLPETIAALERLKASGRRVVLVTGRELDDLQGVCPRLDLFDYVVAENGALLYQPATGKETPLAQRPPDAFVAALRGRGVERISVGRVIVATWEPHETAVLETIRDQGLELQVIFNKGAVMVLPAGVNKATGLSAALERLGLSAHNAVGIGDAENDHALLALCECGVAVANALPTLKAAADFVTTGARGAGVTEVMGALLSDDLVSHAAALNRHHVLLGWDSSENEVRVAPYGQSVLLAGETQRERRGGGPALVHGLLERLADSRYSFCVLDPLGRYENLRGAVSLGTAERAPALEEVVKLLGSTERNCAVNLIALAPAELASFLQELMPRIAELRARTGQPHWLVIDEVAAQAAGEHAVSGMGSVLRITQHPDLVEPTALAIVDLLVVTGNNAVAGVEEFCRGAGISAPRMDPMELKSDEALAWWPRAGNAVPFRLRMKGPER